MIPIGHQQAFCGFHDGGGAAGTHIGIQLFLSNLLAIRADDGAHQRDGAIFALERLKPQNGRLVRRALDDRRQSMLLRTAVLVRDRGRGPMDAVAGAGDENKLYLAGFVTLFDPVGE